ncbi:MAG: radical SAM protein [Acidaminococcaceae bacterium]|jgi:MoaA/NifB/PqqE/SkfB family radical SAM enzyme|nr:radical SAM protein [Acidaminococcaceae bacterium]
MDVKYAAARTSAALLVDHILATRDVATRQKILRRLAALVEKFFGSYFDPGTFAAARNYIEHPEGKWFQFVNRALNELNPKVVKTAVLDLGFDAAFYGLKQRADARKKYHCNIPWTILIDPTSACNLRCTGCWAAEYGHTLNLTLAQLESVISQAKALGVHFFMYTGGEPLMRKADLLKLCRLHPDCEFSAFTNGTLVDEAFCKEMAEVGNLSLSLSLEGFEDVNDSRRGQGTFQKVMHAMDLLKKYGLLFGTSICYTRKNLETVTSDAFLDLIISKGVWYTWYFHYMPVGNEASLDLLPTREQRAYMVRRVRKIRADEGGKPIFAMDFQNDGQYIGGCIAGGRNYCHINPNGDVEPCVFIHYSDANIKEKTLLQCLQQPLFREYGAHQPFNSDMLQPCPMLENPELLERMVHECGAKSTDLQSPENVDQLCHKCQVYAKEWAPVARRLWREIQDRQKNS